MKTINLILIIVSFFSCTKTDNINHYLTKKITGSKLEENGFYKYSYTSILDDEDKIDDTIRSVIKYDMYSNVKPEKNAEGLLWPTKIWGFYREDSIKEKNSNDYIKEKLHNRIITYLFRNDSLFYKNIQVLTLDKSRNEIADFTSRKKIIKYYDSLKISIKPMVKNSISNEIYPTQFMIENFRTRFFFSEEKESYNMFTNYMTNTTYYHIEDDWYSGYATKPHYYF